MYIPNWRSCSLSVFLVALARSRMAAFRLPLACTRVCLYVCQCMGRHLMLCFVASHLLAVQQRRRRRALGARIPKGRPHTHQHMQAHTPTHTHRHACAGQPTGSPSARIYCRCCCWLNRRWRPLLLAAATTTASTATAFTASGFLRRLALGSDLVTFWCSRH